MITQIFTGALVIAMVAVIISDIIRYIIPNWLNVALLVLYVVGVFLFPSDPLLALAAAAIVFVVCIGSFALGLMGGGDAKLLFVLTLWTGWSLVTVEFLFMTAVIGGILVVIVMLLRAVLSDILLKRQPERKLPRLLTRKEPVPYGLAIAGAFLWVLLWGKIEMLSQSIPVS